MRLRTRALSLVAVVATAVFATQAASAFTLGSLSEIYVFGDSIVDAGNTQNILGGPGIIPCAFTPLGPPCDPAPTGLGYFEGRFTDGPNAADRFNQIVEGSNSVASTEGGQNYSFGGARTAGGSIPDLSLQIGQYLLDVGGSADPNALYLINIGGNDVRDQVQATVAGTATLTDQQVIDAAVLAVSTQVGILQAAGATRFLVNGVGDVGALPETQALGAGAQAQARMLSEDMSAALFAALGPQVITVDVIALFDQVLLDPTAFGLPAGINTTGTCIFDGAPVVFGCADFAFFDPVHPSAALNGILGDAMAAAVPEPGTASLIALGLIAMGARRRR